MCVHIYKTINLKYTCASIFTCKTCYKPAHVYVQFMLHYDQHEHRHGRTSADTDRR